MDDFFPETRTSLLDRATQGDQEALTTLVNRYKPAIEGLVGRSGVGRPEKGREDLVFEIMAEICKPSRLEAWKADKGRFRQWVCGITRNMINGEFRRRNAQKRGAGQELYGGEALESVPSQDPTFEEVFDLAWATRTLERAKAKVRAEWQEREEGEAFDKLLPSAMDGVYAEKKQRELAVELGRPAGTIAGLVIKLWKAIVDACFAEVRDTCGSNEDAREELRLQMECLEAAAKNRRKS